MSKSGSPSPIDQSKIAQRVVVALSLIVLIAASLVGSVYTELPSLVKGALQVLTGASGAALGAYLQKDRTRSILHTHVRMAVRGLFDHLALLSQLASSTQEDRLRLEKTQRSASKSTIAPLNRVEDGLSAAIESASSAVYSWSDINDDAFEKALAEYRSRRGRLPGTKLETEEK